LAGAAAAVTGSAFLSSSQRETTTCADNTVVGILQGIATKVSNIEAILGGVDGRVPVKKPGIDIVLGSQWGDEGKGKLVDILSQVCCPYDRPDHYHFSNAQESHVLQ
jgi:hypothetical protein